MPAPLFGAGNSAKIAADCAEIWLIGIRFPAYAVRPEPSTGLPVKGLYACPPPCSAAVKYSLKLQKPVLLVFGLQLCAINAVGTVSRFVVPLVSRVPW